MLKGLFVALVTPFKENGDLNEEKLRELVRFHIESGTDGLVPCATTSENPTYTWQEHFRIIEVVVEDEGHGVPDTSNLFVPFYTTKAKGSGIGLALCLQIAEGHGGTITLENREDRSGCRARLRLPVSGPEKTTRRTETGKS